jgi:hypothetical protein
VIELTDRPAIVRGYLPPITEGVPMRPRGLLVGYPQGLTFEYRVDDVRLLGVRFGGFVDRTDWNGRGGTPLKPLGQVIHLFGGGDPPPTFLVHTGEAWQPMTGTLRATRTTQEDGFLEIEYSDVSGRLRANVPEFHAVKGTSVGPVFARLMTVMPGAPRIALLVAAGTDGTEWIDGAPPGNGSEMEIGNIHWLRGRRPDGALQYVRIVVYDPARLSHTGEDIRLTFAGTAASLFAAKTGGARYVELTYFTTHDDSPKIFEVMWEELATWR